MIRSITPADTPVLVALSSSSGLLQRGESDAIQEMLDQSHATNAINGHPIIAYKDNEAIVGLVYFAPKSFTDRVWELRMIAVDALQHRQRIGSKMLFAVEQAVRALNGRLLLIETSDESSFERTQQFYRKHAYSEVAHILDYFADCDDAASKKSFLAGTFISRHVPEAWK